MWGHKLRRHKLWAQSDVESGYRKYGYPGWQWRIALAQKDVRSVPWLAPVADSLNEGLEVKHNHWIATIYKDGEDAIPQHSDNMKNISPDTWIVVLRLGFARRWLITVEGLAVWDKELPAGAAVFMSAAANSKFKHCVPPMPGAGASGSIVGRQITTKLPWKVVRKRAACAAGVAAPKRRRLAARGGRQRR